MLGGGLLWTMLTVAASVAGLLVLTVGGVTLWLRRRKR